MGRIALTIAVVFIMATGTTSVVGQPTSLPTPAPAPSSTLVPWYQNPDALSITLSTDKPMYKLGDDVLIKIQEQNTSIDSIEFNPLRSWIDYDLYISHGTLLMKPLPLQQRSACSITTSGRMSVIPPQVTATEVGCQGEYSSIRDWGLKISEPGKYYLVAISVEIEQGPHNKQISNMVQLSNIVEITVTR
jgi:hypothetical protein